MSTFTERHGTVKYNHGTYSKYWAIDGGKAIRCELCGDSIYTKPWIKRMHMDHCHIHNIARGWLCPTCNVASMRSIETGGYWDRRRKYITDAVLAHYYKCSLCTLPIVAQSFICWFGCVSLAGPKHEHRYDQLHNHNRISAEKWKRALTMGIIRRKRELTCD